VGGFPFNLLVKAEAASLKSATEAMLRKLRANSKVN